MRSQIQTANMTLEQCTRYAFRTGCLAGLGVAASGLARAADAAPAAAASPFLLALVASAILFFSLGQRRAPANAARARRAPADFSRPMLAAIPADIGGVADRVRSSPPPQLETIEWDQPLTPPTPRAATPAATATQPSVKGEAKDVPAKDGKKPVLLEDGVRQRILDRYISARFAGVANGVKDLMDATHVIKAARLLFEDGQPERSLELLALGAEVNPADQSMTLAELELLYLERNAAGYRRTASRFHFRHPKCDQWPEIRELGRGLGLTDELFRDQGVRENSFPQYGPWPGLPNWIQAPWDLTGEVTLAAFHSRMKARADKQRDEDLRRAA